MKAKRFNLATILCALFSAAFLSVGIVFTVPAKAADVTGEQAQSIFVMDEGASVRIGEEGTADVNGLKFTASMTDANYQGLFGENGSVGEGKTYSKATFGMLIAPASYEDLNYANVFGQEAIYGWSLFNEETGEWLPYEGEKTEIINIYNQKLYQVVDAESGVISWEFRGGSITNLVGEWIATDFQGLAYVELTKNDGTGCDYIMANAGQIANMYEVAVKSYYDENSELTADDKAWIKANYIEAASEAVAVNVGLTPATSIDLAEYGLPAGEYDFYVQQYINKAKDLVENNGKFYMTSKLTKDYVGEKAVATVDGTVVDTSSLEGMYAITAAFPGTEYGYTFYVDRYNEGTFVWNNVNDVNESVRISDAWGTSSWHIRPEIMTELTYIEDNESDTVTAGRSGNYYKATFTSYQDAKYNTAVDGFGAKVLPVHSREYYTTLFAGKSIIMDYYYTKEVSEELANQYIYWQFVIGYGMGYPAGNLDYSQPHNSWNGRSGWLSRQSLALDTIATEEHWVALLSANGDSNGGHGTMVGLRNAVGDGTVLDYNEKTETYTGEISFYFGNVHLTDTNMNYTEVAYDLEGNEIATTTKSAALGSTVTYTPAEISGYVYVPANENNVLSGAVLGNNTLTLKAYYAPATEETIPGITYQDSYDFSAYLDDVASYAVTQYIVRSSGNVAVDVTSTYADKLTDTVIDLTSFDGIYTVTATASDGSTHKVNFERAIEGVFTWNNINSTQGALIRERYIYNNYLPANTTLDVLTYGSGDELDTLLTKGGQNGTAPAGGTDGIFYKVYDPDFNTDLKGDDGYQPALAVFPTHSLSYYTEVWAGANINFDYFVRTYTRACNATGQGYVKQMPYATADAYGNETYHWRIQNWYTASFSINENVYNRLIAATNKKADGGFGYLFALSTKNVDYADGPVGFYVGNIRLETGYNTEYYVAQANGSYQLNNTVFTKAYAGKTVTANTSYAIENYSYVKNDNEVLTGTVTSDLNYLTLKVYYTTQVNYNVEVYLYDSTSKQFVMSEEYSTTDASGLIGDTISFSEISIPNYIFDPTVEGSVLSGTITSGFALKAYYIPAITETIEGLRSEATLDLGIGEVSEYTLTQYVVNTTNGTSGLGGAATLNGESYTGVDVKAAYPELIANGVADTSMLDGIFKLTAKGEYGIAEYKFEQYKEGVFTWNNIAEEGTGIVSVGMNSRYMWDGAGKYTGTATTSYVTAEDEKFAPIHAGQVYSGTIGTGDDRWWRATADKPTSNTTSMGVRVFPSHTWNYYNTLYNGKVMTFDYFVADESRNPKTQRFECYVAPLTYVELNGSAHTWGYGHYWMHDSFKLTENAFVALTCTNQTSSIRGGSFTTLTNHNNGNFTGPMSVYVGNFGVADGYNVEYYLEQTQKVDGVTTGLGTYSAIPSRIETFTAAVGTEVTANTALSVSTGYAYAANENEILTGTVSADGCITLKVYYKYGA